VRVLVVNAGSSSLKLAVIGDGGVTEDSNDTVPVDGGVDRAALDAALDELGPVDAVGHRVVHGGPRLTEAVVVDDEVRAELAALVPLAPLHQPVALDLLDAVGAHHHVPAVACLDTAFHATLPPAATTYALPASWRRDHGVRRYGFHGLSHQWAARRGPEVLRADPTALRIVTCHLGSGASLAAVAGGRSVDTTMGLTPLDGIVMATRPGALDPGIPGWLRSRGVTDDEIDEALWQGSGLTGVSGRGDLRQVLERAEAGDDDARLGLDVYVRSLRAGIAAMAAALDGVDLVVFTGGVGQHQPAVRAAAVAGLRHLGLSLDRSANDGAAGDGDVDVSAAGATARTVVVAAREDLVIDREVRAVLGRA
jgi:acetate kinase